MNGGALVVLATFPDAETAARIGRELVTARLAACVNILPGATSIYRWQGKVDEATETVAFIKTAAASYAKLEARLKELHPYETPEIVAFEIDRGLPAYLEWVTRESGGRG